MLIIGRLVRLSSSHVVPPSGERCTLFPPAANKNLSFAVKCMKLFNELRKQGVKTREAFNKKSLTEQLEIANRLKVKYALILGQKEIMDGTIIIRDMESGIQEIIDLEKVVPEIKRRLLGMNGLKVYSEKE